MQAGSFDPACALQSSYRLYLRQNASMTRRTIVAVLAAASIGMAACSRQQSPASNDNRSATAAQPAPELTSRVRDGRRVIFIGLDGDDWSLLDRYIKDGVMQSLARLASGGLSGLYKHLDNA